MPVPAIGEYAGNLPDSSDPGTFSQRADQVFAWLVGAVPEANASFAALNAALNADATILDAVAAVQALVDGLHPLTDQAGWLNGVGDGALSPEIVWSAMAEVPLPLVGGLLVLDMLTGFDFAYTLTAARHLAAPANPRVGQKGRIRIMQNGVGGHALTFGAGYVFQNGQPPVISPDPGAMDILYYDVLAEGQVLISSVSSVSAQVQP